MKKTFLLQVEYNSNYSDVDVLRNIMSNIDIDTYKNIGIEFKVDKELKQRYENFITT